MPEPKAEDYLSLLEGISAIASVLDTAKQELVSRGWDERSAEQAAITTVGQHIAAGAWKGRRP